MAKAKSEYQCRECGAKTPKWAGQCADCGAWNSLDEQAVTSTAAGQAPIGYAGESPVRRLSEVDLDDQPRLASGIGELDRVLGGGVVPGAVVLVGGDPGIGKSTLLLQMVAELQQRVSTLYITGEESLQQVGLRARRLGLSVPDLQVMSETCSERIAANVNKQKPAVAVIDSIQTIFTESLTSAPGSVSQLRESTAQLVRLAKQTGTALFLVGHVTKEGQIAGPRVLEHMVDTVLYFESDPGSRFRVIRSVKNRFGAANEIGVFAMVDQGLKPVTNPSAIFLQRHEESVPGSSVMVTWEGTRPMLVEVQALVDQSHSGSPRRLTLGLDQNRLAVLLAVLHRHAGLAMFDQDVFVNVVGGVKVTETASDLALLLAALSSFRDKPLPKGWVVFGEIGLAGEIRPVPHGEERIREAAKQGFTRAIVPAANKPKRQIEGIEVVGVQRLSDVLELSP